MQQLDENVIFPTDAESAVKYCTRPSSESPMVSVNQIMLRDISERRPIQMPVKVLIAYCSDINMNSARDRTPDPCLIT
jgi:hypothetical protein